MFPVLVLVLLGISSASGRPPPEHVILPIDAYQLTSEEDVAVKKALRLLVTHCMRSQGYSDIDIPPSLVGAVVPIPINDRRYGVIDETAARRFGYHLPPVPGSDRRAAELDAWLAELDRQADVTLFGTDKSPGCLGSAHATLSQGIPAANTGWLTEIDTTSLEQSSKDSRVEAAIARWRTCLREKNMDYADPYEALADPQWNLDSPDIPDQEIRTAVADVRCKKRANLVETWMTVETEIQQDHIRQNSDMFAELAQARHTFVLNAKRVVDSHGR